MNTYTVRVTQNLSGWYEGEIEIEAKDKTEAMKKIKSLSKEEIDDMVHWTHGDEYFDDVDSIEIDFDTFTKL